MDKYEIGNKETNKRVGLLNGLDTVTLLGYDIKLADIERIELIDNTIHCYMSRSAVPLYIATLKTTEQAKQYYDELVKIWHMWQADFIYFPPEPSTDGSEIPF